MLSVSALRPRASNIELESPKPELHPEGYSDARVQSAIKHTRRRLHSITRRPSPVVENLVLIYLGAEVGGTLLISSMCEDGGLNCATPGNISWGSNSPNDSAGVWRVSKEAMACKD